jgi:hypothetical protein
MPWYMQLAKGTVIMEALVCVVIAAQTGMNCCCTIPKLDQSNLCISIDDMVYHLPSQNVNLRAAINR